MALPIAVQLYSVRQAAKEDLYGTLKKVKELGYDGVEFAGLHDNTPTQIKAWCEELSLVPVSAHVPFADMLADADGVFAAYAEIGVQFVAIPSLAEDLRPGKPGFFTVPGEVARVSEVAKKYGITLLYHNHDFEFVRIDGEYGLDYLYRNVSADLLQTELDSCWVKVAGEEPAEYIRKYAGRCPVVHLKDFFGEKSENMYELIGEKNAAPQRPSGFEFRPVGAGLQNFPEILVAAKASGASWVVVEQDKPSMGLDELQSVEKSIEYLKSLNW